MVIKSGIEMGNEAKQSHNSLYIIINSDQGCRIGRVERP